MARYKKRWLAERARAPCPQCGYTQPIVETAPVSRGECFHDSISPVSSMQTPTMTSESVASTMEEGLLIGSDHNGYGSIEPVEPTLVQPEEVVVGKGKKSKKAADGSSKRVAKVI